VHLALLLQMASDGMADRVAVGTRSEALTMLEVSDRARRIGAYLATQPGERIGFIDVNSAAVPLSLFGAALAGKPFVPLNYRLTDDGLRALVARNAPAVAVVGEGVVERLGPVDGVVFLSRKELLEIGADEQQPLSDPYGGDPDDIAVLLYTSGTTGEPKAAVLRHRNLTSYILSTVEFAGAGEDEAAIVSVPPYHIAGLSAVLSSTFAGRRLVYVESFDPATWVATVRAEQITQAMVVPTMLNRILDVLEQDGHGLPTLRSLSYGGGPMPGPVIERALQLLPGVDFVNAYGLTETSSTIALLGPEDHREALASGDPAVRARLSSVGRPLGSVIVSIRDPEGRSVPTGEPGEICVQGEQVSGEYLGTGGADDGWFHTRDAGHLDEAGFLYVHGRLDDVIVRGGENLSPGEIESVLLEHPGVVEAAVVGVPDVEWGEKVVAAVVPADGSAVEEGELRAFVRARLRSTKTPERIQLRTDLPFNETGKLLRRVLRDELAALFAVSETT
jgi:acyl-CoA synthetase (AMP-forming)/AMP-acid ligase II